MAVGALNAGYVAVQEGDAETASWLFHECLDITRRIVARPLLGYQHGLHLPFETALTIASEPQPATSPRTAG